MTQVVSTASAPEASAHVDDAAAAHTRSLPLAPALDRSKRGLLFISAQGEMKRIPPLDSKKALVNYDFSPLFKELIPDRAREIEAEFVHVYPGKIYALVENRKWVPGKYMQRNLGEYCLYVAQLNGKMNPEMNQHGGYDPLPPHESLDRFLEEWADIGDLGEGRESEYPDGNGGVILLNGRASNADEIECKVKHMNFYEGELALWEERFAQCKAGVTKKRERPEILDKELDYPSSHDESSMPSEDEEEEVAEPPLKKQKVE